MAQTAANWLEHLLPHTPYRQWVLSFDSPLAVRLGYDARALDLVCRCFATRVLARLRWLCKRQHQLGSVTRLHPGMVVVVQRFRADGGLFVHLHALCTDGAFEELPRGEVVFRPLTGLCEAELVRVLAELAEDLARARVLDDVLDLDGPLAACVQLSLSTSAHGSAPACVPELVVHAHDMSLHAASSVDGRDRRRLERLCKYLLRPPFAHDAVHRLPDGRVRLELPRKHRFVDTTPEQFLAKLACTPRPPSRASR